MYNSAMIADLKADQYNMDLEKKKIENNFIFAVSKVMKVFFYLCKLLLQIFWGVIKAVLKTFGVPVGN